MRQAVSISYFGKTLLRNTSTFSAKSSGLKFLRRRFTLATKALFPSA
ncbi:hypothetical protein ACMYZ8_02110 [Bacteroides sp. KG156]